MTTAVDAYIQIYGKCCISLSGYPTPFSNHHCYAKRLANDLQQSAVWDPSIRVVYRAHGSIEDVEPNTLLVVSSDVVPSVAEPWDVPIFVMTPPDILVGRGMDYRLAPDPQQSRRMLEEMGPEHLHIVTDSKWTRCTGKETLHTERPSRYSPYRDGVLGHVVEELSAGTKNVSSKYYREPYDGI